SCARQRGRRCGKRSKKIATEKAGTNGPAGDPSHRPPGRKWRSRRQENDDGDIGRAKAENGSNLNGRASGPAREEEPDVNASLSRAKEQGGSDFQHCSNSER